MRRTSSVVAVAAGGIACAWLLALAFGVGPWNATVLTGISSGCAGAAGGVGWFILGRGRPRSFGVQIATVAMTSVVAVAAGTFAAARDMFLSASDARDMLVILIASGTVGVISSFALTRRMVDSVKVLSERADAIELIPEVRSEASEGVLASHELEKLRERLDRSVAQLAESESKRRALETSRRELVAWVSHDLRTPLAGLRSLAEALEDGIADDPETVRRYHSTMVREVDELSRLVDDLFELSRIQAGVLDLRVEPASLDDLLSDAVAMAIPVAEAKGVRINGALGTDIGPVQLATPEFLRVMRNLLDNAIRHTPADGEITVESGRRDGHAFVCVRDTCGGIPDDEIDRVFDLAYRGDTARRHGNGDGAGLGLSIAQGLIAAQQGGIDVVNEDNGCRFTVTVPLAAL